MTSASKRLHQAPADLGTIYRLADHLDATLAMGEDLLAAKLGIDAATPGDRHDVIADRSDAVARFARGVRALELGIISRLLQARTRAAEVHDLDPRFSPVLGLMIGGTAPLADAAARRGASLGDVSETALTGGPEVLQFLVSRGMLEGQILSLGAVRKLAVSNDYLLAGNVHLGTLLDMVAQILDTLDLAFGLYAEPRKCE